MKIVITNNDADKQTVLCHGSSRALNQNQGPVGLNAGSQVAAQIAEALRARYARPLERGNRRTTLSFGVRRRVQDPLRARFWLLWHLAECLRSGTVKFEETTQTGSISSVSLLDAVVQLRGVAKGVTIELQYDITGGALEFDGAAGDDGDLEPIPSPK